MTLKKTKDDFDRISELYKTGNVAKTDFETAENNYANITSKVNINKAQYELARKKLSDRSIVSPFNSIVLKINVQEGQKIKSGISLITIIEKTNWIAVLNIDQKELPFVELGQKAYVVLDSFPDKKFTGKVIFIGAEINKENGTCEIRVELQEGQSIVKHGMAGSSEILAADFLKVDAIPSRFVIKNGNDESIVVWDGNKANVQKVKTKMVGEKWRILTGIKDGAILLDPSNMKNFNKLMPGNEVKEL